MSNRFVTMLALVTAALSLSLSVGCATAPTEKIDVEEVKEADESSEVPTVETTSTVEPAATGVTCGCASSEEYQNGLCYPKCASGWSGAGPVCWQNCASGFRDTGWFCHRDSQVIGANTSACPWYNKCGWGSDCNKCPAGYINDGCTCRIDAYIYAQPSYGRGEGRTPSCSQY